VTVLWAPAKLTLSLRVTGVRDDGYHLIDAEMGPRALGARWPVRALDGGSVLSMAGGGPPPGGEDDLVLRALRACGRSAAVVLEKSIPSGAGLGGGSADAAAVLRWAGVDDLTVAASLGADVPFCVVGGRARVGGIGEQVESLGYEERTFTLLTPAFGCATPAVYEAWDRLGGPSGDHENDLEPAALVVEPRLVEVRDRLGDATGRLPRLAGSGSTWFVEGAFPDVGLVVATTPSGWEGPG
jgi:4-diphosphocytidyl-2-C-methyl-D-erythritol kinase